MASLPTPGGDSGTWGTMLNSFLEVSLTTQGYLSLVTRQTSNYTIGSNSSGSPGTVGGETVMVDASSGAITVTLPDATLSNNIHNIKKIDSSANNVTINTTSSQTIDGGSSAIIKLQYVSVTVVSNGSNWSVV